MGDELLRLQDELDDAREAARVARQAYRRKQRELRRKRVLDGVGYTDELSLLALGRDVREAQAELGLAKERYELARCSHMESH